MKSLANTDHPQNPINPTQGFAASLFAGGGKK